MRSVDTAERQRRARHGPRVLVGARVRVGARRRGRLVALRVRGNGDGFVRRVQVRHRRQRPRALPVVRHLDPRYRAQQTEPGTTGHHVGAGAGRECPGPRALLPVRGARLCAHRCRRYANPQSPTSHRNPRSRARTHDPSGAGRHCTVNGIAKKTIAQQIAIVNSVATCMCLPLPAKF